MYDFLRNRSKRSTVNKEEVTKEDRSKVTKESTLNIRGDRY